MNLSSNSKSDQLVLVSNTSITGAPARRKGRLKTSWNLDPFKNLFQNLRSFDKILILSHSQNYQGIYFRKLSNSCRIPSAINISKIQEVYSTEDNRSSQESCVFYNCQTIFSSFSFLYLSFLCVGVRLQ